jgi:hypothetical protein
MPRSNVNAPTGSAQNSLPDPQMLIALLSSLMPLLQRMQSQFAGLPPTTLDPFLFSPGGLSSPAGSTVPNPAIDHQAAVSFVEDIAADSLRNLSHYLDTYAEQHVELAACVAIVTQAARCFAMRDYAQAFGLIWQAYRVIAVARSANPQLPPLRPVGQAGSASPTPH